MTTEILKEKDFVKMNDLSLAGFFISLLPIGGYGKRTRKQKSPFYLQKRRTNRRTIASFWRG
jgi:lysozyme family protein